MNVKIVFLSNSKLNKLTINSIEKYNKLNKSFLTYISLEDIQTTDKSDYPLLNQLYSIYEKYYQNYDYIIFLRNHTAVLDFDKMFYHMNECGFDKSIFAFRITNIRGIGLKHSPRIPYIDDTFIALNLNKAKEKSYFDRKLINGVHFYKYARNQALMQSMIEFSLEKGEFINIFKDQNIQNEYGDNISKLFPYPFSLCKESSIINADIKYNPQYFYCIKDGEFEFIKKHSMKLFILRWLKKSYRFIANIQNKEFKKSYDEK